MKKRRILALLLVCVFTMIPFVSNAATNDWKKHTKLMSFGVHQNGTNYVFGGYKTLDKGKWYRNKKGWWYQWSDGTYPTSEIVEIDGEYYQFTADGYLYQTGYYNGQWHDGNGAMQFGNGCYGASWHKDKFGWWYGTTSPWSPWYKRNGWLKIDNKWYFFDSMGYILQNAVLEVPKGDDTVYYFFNGSGALVKTIKEASNVSISTPDYVYTWYKSEDERKIVSSSSLSRSTGGSSGSGESYSQGWSRNNGSNGSRNLSGDGIAHNSNENYSFTSN